MTYLYYNKKGLVKMRSEKKLKKAGTLIEKKIALKKLEKEKLAKNYITTIVNDELKFEKPPRLKRREAKGEKRALREKAKAGTLNMEDVTQFIINYI
jgi:hypothetical protein